MKNFFVKNNGFICVSVYFFREDDGMMVKKTSSAFIPNDFLSLQKGKEKSSAVVYSFSFKSHLNKFFLELLCERNSAMRGRI